MRYVLYLKIEHRWQHFAEFEATDNLDAFGKAISRLPREHFDKPISLKPVNVSEELKGRSNRGPN
jgi:hypothetical protein